MFDVPIYFFVGFMIFFAPHHDHQHNHDHQHEHHNDHQNVNDEIINITNNTPVKSTSSQSQMIGNEPVESDAVLRERFNKFIKQFNKGYDIKMNPFEYERRFENYKRALERIRLLNEKRSSASSAVYGITKYSDMDEEEFRRNHLRRHGDDHLPHESYVHQIHYHARDHNHYKKRSVVNEKPKNKDKTMTFDGLPKMVDWREKGVISEVRNQGKCGACWAHSVLETIESLMAIKRNTTIVEELSVQQMVDCARNDNFGCNGGNTCNLLEWLVDNNVTIANKSVYPSSETGWTATCKIMKIKSGARVTKFVCENFMDKEMEILKYLANHGPISAAVDAISWQNYLGGVIQYHCDSDPTHLNHAVQIVGYDLSGEIPYYIIRNTWGIDFGNSGYMKIKIGNNLCGIANEISVIYVSEV